MMIKKSLYYMHLLLLVLKYFYKFTQAYILIIFNTPRTFSYSSSLSLGPPSDPKQVPSYFCVYFREWG